MVLFFDRIVYFCRSVDPLVRRRLVRFLRKCYYGFDSFMGSQPFYEVAFCQYQLRDVGLGVLWPRQVSYHGYGLVLYVLFAMDVCSRVFRFLLYASFSWSPVVYFHPVVGVYVPLSVLSLPCFVFIHFWGVSSSRRDRFLPRVVWYCGAVASYFERWLFRVRFIVSRDLRRPFLVFFYRFCQ